MRKKEFINFYSTTARRDLYKFLIDSTSLHAERLLKKKIKLNFIIKKIPSINFFFVFFKFVLTFSFIFEKKCASLKYKKVDIGLYAVSIAYREPASHISKIYYYVYLLRYVFTAGAMIDAAEKISNNVDVVYIDHPVYLNSVYFKIFAEKKKIVYTNHYPRGLFYIDFRKKNNSRITISTKALSLSKKNKIQKFKLKPKKEIIKFFKNPSAIPWFKNTKFNSKIEFKKSIKKVDYIIYAHSFLDGNISYGYDGFINLENWLNFTIEKLIKKNSRVIIKGHPNFYNETFGKTAETDKNIFKKIYNKYKDENLIFINNSVNNSELLKHVDKKAVLITHHGTIAIEGALLGFKCICSKATFWDDSFQIANQWSNKAEYVEILQKNWKQLNYSNKNDLKIFTSQLFSEYSYFGEKFWDKKIIKYLKNSETVRITHQHAKEIPKSKYLDIINQITKCITEIKFKAKN